MRVMLYLSPTSRDNLIDRARDLGYIKMTTTTARGLNGYIEELSFKTLVDARPASIQGSPFWFANEDEPRMRVLMEVDDNAVMRLLEAAGRLKVYNQRKSFLGITQRNSVLGALVDALGSGWIKPLEPLDDATVKQSKSVRTQG